MGFAGIPNSRMKATMVLEQLRATEEKYKNAVTSTCYVNVSEMAKDSADVIYYLLTELDGRRGEK